MRTKTIEGMTTYLKRLMPRIRALNNGSLKEKELTGVETRLLASAYPSTMYLLGKPMRSVNMMQLTLKDGALLIRDDVNYVVRGYIDWISLWGHTNMILYML